MYFHYAGENYVDVVQQAEGDDGDGRYIVFFFFMTVFGLFFIMAMVAGFFESGEFRSGTQIFSSLSSVLHESHLFRRILD